MSEANPGVVTPSVENLPTRGFDEVTNATDGQYVSVTGHVDRKFVCMDLSPSQRDICTTALVTGSNETFQSVPVRLRVCSEALRRNCIVFPIASGNVDFRDVYVLDDAGNVIDFDGERLLEAPNTWISESVPIKLTGRVTVFEGKGKFIQPIEKIEGV